MYLTAPGRRCRWRVVCPTMETHLTEKNRASRRSEKMHPRILRIRAQCKCTQCEHSKYNTRLQQHTPAGENLSPLDRTKAFTARQLERSGAQISSGLHHYEHYYCCVSTTAHTQLVFLSQREADLAPRLNNTRTALDPSQSHLYSSPTHAGECTLPPRTTIVDDTSCTQRGRHGSRQRWAWGIEVNECTHNA